MTSGGSIQTSEKTCSDPDRTEGTCDGQATRTQDCHIEQYCKFVEIHY